MQLRRNVAPAKRRSRWLGCVASPSLPRPSWARLAPRHIDDAIAALSVTLTDDEVARLGSPYTPRMDYQGVSDPMMLARAVEVATGFKTAAA